MQIDPGPSRAMFEEGGIGLTRAEFNFLDNVASGGTKDSYSQVVASMYAGKLLARFARVLNWATWALVFATIGLIIATLAQ